MTSAALPSGRPAAGRDSTGRTAAGALIGLLAGGVAVAAGELVAALVRPAAAPVIAVGNRLILLTPEPVKRWAIREFGTGDKHALLTGIYLVLAACAVVIGIVAVRRLRWGLLGVGLLGVLGVYCSQTTAAHRVSDAVPSVLGAAAGMLALWRLVAAVSPDRVAERDGTGRRGFLAAGLATAGAALVAGFGGRALQHRRFDASAARAAIRLPDPVSGPDARPSASAGAVSAGTGNNYDRGLTSVPFRTPADRFYRIDTALTVPQIDPKTWKLRIDGMVRTPLTLTYADLLARPLVERWMTLCCVSNEVGGELIGNATFRGVLLADLLREAGVLPGADQLVAESSDGMTIGSPTAVVLDGRDAMLAVGMNGEPLTPEHGFPVRMVVPGLYGYVSACKWITRLRATTFADFSAYWVKGGWAARGPVKLASRIDRPVPPQVVRVGTPVPVAGVAWDQHVGVSRVQVGVDDGPWQDATLVPVPSSDTWRQWVFQWTPGAAGQHRLRVRAFDATGAAQDERETDPFPSGATGLHSVTILAR